MADRMRPHASVPVGQINAQSLPTPPPASAMSIDAAEKVCATLYCLPFEELYGLDNCDFPWLLAVKGMGLTLAVDTVRRSIMAVGAEQQRFQCIARLYAWLIPRRIYRTWVLHRLGEALSNTDRTLTCSSFVNAFHTTGSLVAHGSVNTGLALCLTVMVLDDSCWPPECTPICFAMWHGLPYVAVSIWDRTAYIDTYLIALVSVLGALEDCCCGVSDDLDSLHIEAKRRARQSRVQGLEPGLENN
ncbi:hypothetical protein HPB51_004910 [Rhipicephalus microplus]|uniref:Uncharacterized protein n=1 Tax=Rhipicephalus microplus TaxID=6941 RepID=A0A9J6E5L2_RHIMP|nr:hypothetical protein HPB51_004910 [Rhipicephalus microplus]